MACCSLSPAAFSRTRGLASEAIFKGKLVHTLGYQNSVKNLSTGGNALLLPIPARPRTMTAANIVDTSSAPDFFDSIERAFPVPLAASGASQVHDRGVTIKAPIVFEHDIYTIVLAGDAEQIPAVLKRVPAARRPNLNPEIFKAYARWYKGWTFALCCFNNREQANAKPMLWWYEPSDPSTLFFPALDAHTGHAPDLGASVDVDHLVAFGTNKHIVPTSWPVDYAPNEWVAFIQKSKTSQKMSTTLRQLLPRTVLGQRFSGIDLPNGDFVVQLSDLLQGQIRISRQLPPGAAKS